MATSSYGDPDSQMPGGSAGIYVTNGGTPPAQQQQQQQHMHTDPELQLRENLQQLQQGTEMLHSATQAHQMNAMNAVHHHFQTPPRPAHSPQHMAQSAQSVMGMEEHNPYGDHDSARAKRSKVSRACDECRRKKIRCDATSENGPEACSSCKRTAARCQFSRQPMKRGPSKGYIKELADRLNSLENQIHQPQAPAYDFGPVSDPALGEAQTPAQFSRKRTHSMSESFQDMYGRGTWSGQDRGTDFTYVADMPYPLTHEDPSLNGGAPNSNRRVSFGEMTLAGNLITGSNEATIKAYYNTIHPTLPLLPQDSASLNRLTHCPAKLREAFFLALEASVRSFAPRALPASDISIVQLVHLSYEAVDAAKYLLSDADSSQHFLDSLVYCQSLLFLVIASDRPSPGTVGSTSELLGRVAGCISDVGINDAKVLTALRDSDAEIYEAARRTFWVAFILDRFHATSKSKDIVLPLHSGSISRADFNTLGETSFHLARVADIVGQVAYIARAGSVPNIDPSSPYAFAALTAASPTSLYLNGQLTRFRESLDISDLPPNSTPYLAYQYLRVFIARLSESGSFHETLTLTKELLSNLASGLISPLHHIFASLVATALADMSDRLETQVEAHASMKEMTDSLANGQIIHRSFDNLGWEAALRDILNQKKAPTPPSPVPEQTSPAAQPNMAGLQHLAAAAVGEREGAEPKPASSGGNGMPSSNAPEHGDDLTAAMKAASEAAKAQATAAAALQPQLQSNSTNGASASTFDSSALVKDGF